MRNAHGRIDTGSEKLVDENGDSLSAEQATEQSEHLPSGKRPKFLEVGTEEQIPTVKSALRIELTCTEADQKLRDDRDQAAEQGISKKPVAWMVNHVADESEIERHRDGLVDRSLYDVLLGREHRQEGNIDHAHETGDAREAEYPDAVFNSVNGNRQPVADRPNADWISGDEKDDRNDGVDGKGCVEPLSAFFQRVG